MKNISREYSFTISFTKFLLNFLNRGACFSFLIIPAMFFNCSKPIDTFEDSNLENTTGFLKSNITEDYKINSLDAFFFDSGLQGKLDCYQRIDNPGKICSIASGSGPKTLLLIANSQRDKYEWADIKSLGSISEITLNLEEESIDAPVMTSILNTTAGEEINLNLTPLRSEIMIRSIRCDFSGKPYSHESFTLRRAYLTYVNASCRVIPEQNSLPSRIINAGLMDEGHLKLFQDKEMIIKKFDQNIKTEPVYLECSLFCYANNSVEESIGTPFTKLVIEGNIGDDTYYYPIKLNSRSGGLCQGHRYIYDIVLTRAGATDPDGEIDESNITINMEVEEWRKKNTYKVGF